MLDPKRYYELAKIIQAAGSSGLRWCEADACACSGCVNLSMLDVFKKRVVTPPTHEEWLEVINTLLRIELDAAYFFYVNVSQVPENYTGFKEFVDLKKKARISSNRLGRLFGYE